MTSSHGNTRPPTAAPLKTALRLRPKFGIRSSGLSRQGRSVPKRVGLSQRGQTLANIAVRFRESVSEHLARAGVSFREGAVVGERQPVVDVTLLRFRIHGEQ